MPKFYQTPGGALSTSEKQWKDDMQSEGLNPKGYKGRKTFEVPTKAVELMEFLTFHNVNVVNPRSPDAAQTTTGGAPPPTPLVPPVAPLPTSTTIPDLDELFESAPLARQLHLASLACENARTRIK